MNGCIGVLGVKSHETSRTDATDRRLPGETRVATMPAVVMQPAAQGACAPRRGRIGPTIRPLAQQRLNEALRFAVRAGRVGASAEVAQPLPGAEGGDAWPQYQGRLQVKLGRAVRLRRSDLDRLRRGDTMG